MEITQLDTSDEDVAKEVGEIPEESTGEKQEFNDNEYIDLDAEKVEDANYTEDISSDHDKPSEPEQKSVDPVAVQTQVLQNLAESFKQTAAQNQQQMAAIMQALNQKQPSQQTQPQQEPQEEKLPDSDEWIENPAEAAERIFNSKIQELERQRQEAEQKHQEEQTAQQQLLKMQNYSYQKAVEMVPDVGKNGSQVRQLTNEILQNMNQGNAVLFATLAAHYLTGGTFQKGEGLAQVQEQARAQERTRIERTKQNPPSPTSKEKKPEYKFSPEEVQALKATGAWGNKEVMENYKRLRSITANA